MSIKQIINEEIQSLTDEWSKEIVEDLQSYYGKSLNYTKLYNLIKGVVQMAITAKSFYSFADFLGQHNPKYWELNKAENYRNLWWGTLSYLLGNTDRIIKDEIDENFMTMVISIMDNAIDKKQEIQSLNENVYKVYHGTNEKFSQFSLNRSTQGIIWFTDSIDSIKNNEHGGQGSKYIMTRYITINNPAGWNEYEKYGLGQLRGMGYDGVILPQDGKTDYFVFSTKNISAKPN